MKHQLSIDLRRADGSLVRLLGLATAGRPVGYSRAASWPPPGGEFATALSLAADPLGADAHRVHLTVSAEKALQPLINQLQKLHDVQHIEVIS